MTTGERLRADRLLVEAGHFESRARARGAIEAGLVRADGVVVRRASDLIARDAAIVAEAPHPYVSRGGLKLAAALDAFALDPAGQTCLDIGASTGGFTDVLLRRGAAFVHAVDVGRGQLHPSLAGDPRVSALEATDARSLSPFPEPPSLLVIDVSFISLRLVLPPVVPLLAPDAALVALIKPQFEAGREHVGRGGLVRDEAVRDAVCERIRTLIASLGFSIRGLIPSPVEGGDGNREFLIGAVREAGR
ncbi:TlyA family RNA methyltransferase [Methylobacterium frigidaeris]|uniref:Hemolysin A n=1 Tax=Methylobacterium frigidaeris TaxID=2038277 RepID=A0AA37HF31_9HYPH|nr:TlyA family RNA methyltransferase [Methylobacterium frigidaeris]PIK71987.1 TlyA family rRNA (cytidine-2'-O)-methyltransferase [Methylobacterium frigidaeris]GJD64857.1 Hemolysin A [Methylobacterium frigidaeris]